MGGRMSVNGCDKNPDSSMWCERQRAPRLLQTEVRRLRSRPFSGYFQTADKHIVTVRVEEVYSLKMVKFVGN